MNNYCQNCGSWGKEVDKHRVADCMLFPGSGRARTGAEDIACDLWWNRDTGDKDMSYVKESK